MEMTDLEILSSYRQAKKKKEQITILSQLNACSKEKIIEILKNNGIQKQELPRNRKKKVDTVPVSKNQVKEVKKEENVTMKNDLTAHRLMHEVINNLSSLADGIEKEISNKSNAVGKIRDAAKLLNEVDEMI